MKASVAFSRLRIASLLSKASAKIDFYLKRKILFEIYFGRRVQLPKDDTLAVIFLPFSMKTAGVAAPARSISPALKGCLYFAASLEALQMDKYGLSNMALLLSLCCTSLSKDRLISKLLSDIGSGCHAPTTNAEEEQLSAITSSSENLKFSYRESITSMAGAHAWINSGISASDISLSRSFFNKKAISGSALGWMNFSKGNSSPLL